MAASVYIQRAGTLIGVRISVAKIVSEKKNSLLKNRLKPKKDLTIMLQLVYRGHAGFAVIERVHSTR